MTNIEMLELLLKPHIKTCELAKLIGKSRSVACRMMGEIHEQAMQEGLRPVRGYASTGRVIKFLGLDLDEIISKARIEKEFGIGRKRNVCK